MAYIMTSYTPSVGKTFSLAETDELIEFLSAAPASESRKKMMFVLMEHRKGLIAAITDQETRLKNLRGE